MKDLDINTNLSKEPTKRYYPELDCLRGLAIFLLLCFHTDVARFIDIGIFPNDFFQSIISSAAVPVFFFLSGLGLTIKYKNKELELKEFYSNRYKNLVPPYIFWTFLIFVIVTIGNNVIASGDIPSISSITNTTFLANFFINYFVGMATGNVYTLWFVYVLFLYYLIFPAIFKLFKKLKFKEKQLILVILFVLTYLGYLLNDLGISMFFIGDKGVVYSYSSKGINYVVDLTFFFRFIPFFVNFLLGIDIGFNYEGLKEKLKKSTTLKLIIVCSAIFSYIFFQMFDLVYDVGVIGSTKYIFLSTCSIFLSLLLFAQISNWEKIVSKDQLSNQKINQTNIIEKNETENTKNSPLKTIQNKFVKFWYFTGQNSTGIYFTHRVVMAAVWVILYLTLGLTLWKEFGSGVSRLEAFLYCSLSLIMIYIGCIILIKIIRKIPKNEYILSKPKS